MPGVLAAVRALPAARADRRHRVRPGPRVTGGARRDERGAAGVRFAIVFVVVAAVLAVAFYGLDAYAHTRVERAVATQLRASWAPRRRRPCRSSGDRS